MKSKYVKLTHREHILKRPDTYVGSMETEPMNMFVVDNCDLSNINIVKKEVNSNPGFVKLFDEIITNASDHAIRTNKVKFIKVVIEDSKIIIENDGPTIPIEIHPDEKIYNAELIFSHLLTGENYDDTEERNVAGKNGYGSKIVNVFSKKFKVECCDGKQLYRQWTKDNMSKIEKPEINKVTDTKSFTRITYYPDYDKFGMDKLTEDIRSVIYKRCLDVAAYIPHVRISVDGKTLPVKKIQDYMKMHLPEDSDLFYETLDNGWEVGIAKSTSHTFESVGIVNSLNTSSGTHINFISLQLSKDIADKLPKKIKTSWTDVKNKLFLFLVCEINQPSFDTQTKENLTNRMTTEVTGGCSVSEKTVKKIMKSDIVTSILEELEMKQKLQLKKMGGGKKSKVNMPKLVDANKAGTKDSEKCSLFITEGDSAQSGAIAGLSIIGREYYGAFPLKGKLLNIRDASPQKIKGNKEIQALLDIIGLQFGKTYTDLSELRYGKIILFTDADCVDGETHVKIENGTKKLKDISKGDKVLTHKGRYKKVLDKIRTYKEKHVEITYNGETFKFSENHKLIVIRGGKAIEILAKDILKTDSLLIKK